MSMITMEQVQAEVDEEGVLPEDIGGIVLGYVTPNDVVMCRWCAMWRPDWVERITIVDVPDQCGICGDDIGDYWEFQDLIEERMEKERYARDKRLRSKILEAADPVQALRSN